jgi:hypothetical protein
MAESQVGQNMYKKYDSHDTNEQLQSDGIVNREKRRNNQLKTTMVVSQAQYQVVAVLLQC